jgi:hypothetical protein
MSQLLLQAVMWWRSARFASAALPHWLARDAQRQGRHPAYQPPASSWETIGAYALIGNITMKSFSRGGWKLALNQETGICRQRQHPLMLRKPSSVFVGAHA